jgi:two-component system, chemotaxis family, chemotaxis protein CheY
MSLPVLVVDDSNLARRLLIASLPPEWDVEISQASNGAEALELLRQGKGEVMFLDLTMPVLDGFGVLARLQRSIVRPFVVVVSADIQRGAVERAMQLGAAAFVEKPVKAAALLEVLKEHGLYERTSA